MPSDPPKTVTLVLGGARSGKSRYAQELAAAFSRVVYIATARRDDAEMRARIAQHRRERPSAWKTIEVSAGLDHVLREQGPSADLLLIDCLTVYMANIMGRKSGGRRKIRSHIQSLCEAVREAEASVILVSNEVGSGIVPPYRSGRDYRDLLGDLNQQMAKVADRVLLMVAGLPLTVKDRSQRKEDDTHRI
ncbi:MAG: bifunctional adenosylcobinamide kinase/adenosylcobinamide-phosphate guanylyltransferase [Terriglobia bacterium]|jgi:adenosylcobinamide kinase/adenosylcobinamide-phosphate guanylyltransferase